MKPLTYSQLNECIATPSGLSIGCQELLGVLHSFHVAALQGFSPPYTFKAPKTCFTLSDTCCSCTRIIERVRPNRLSFSFGISRGE